MLDINRPVTNPELVNCMNTFFNERNTTNELILIEQIEKAHFLVPITLQGEIINGVLKEGSHIHIKIISDSSKDTYFMAFTDWEQLSKWSQEKEETLVLTYADLKSIVFKDTDSIKGFVINPYGQNIIITPKLMEYFQQRKSEITLKKDSKIFLGQPADYPYEMVDALIAFFKNRKEVDSAYLFLAHREEDITPNLLFVIDFSGDKMELFPQIADIAQNYLGKNDFVDIIALDTSFGKDATKDATPFYKKNYLEIIK